MNKYVPKVGDKVRATLGESVIVGDITYEFEGGRIGRPEGWEVCPDGSVRSAQVWLSEGWHFEQVVSVPTKFGAVIRRADGVKFVLVYHDMGIPGWMRSDDDDAYPAEYATAGGFTVLFEGVDE